MSADTRLRRALRDGDVSRAATEASRAGLNRADYSRDTWHTCYEDLPHGAIYVKVTDHYCELVEVTDLDGACGAKGLALVESRSCAAYLGGEPEDTRRRQRERSALESCGPGVQEFADMLRQARRDGYTREEVWTLRAMVLAQAYCGYGGCDTSESETVCTEQPIRPSEAAALVASWKANWHGGPTTDDTLGEVIRAFGPDTDEP